MAGIISVHPDRAAATARRYGIANYANHVDFSSGWQADAQAVMIGTTPHTHYEIARAALEAGKHVLTEKPMTIDPQQGRQLAELAASKRLVLAVVHNFQFSRASSRFRNILAEKKLGAIKTIYGVQLCNHSRKIHDWCDDMPLGLFFDEAPHFYYMLRWLGGGELKLLNASVWRNEEGRNTPRTVTGEYRAPNNVPIYLHINFGSSITEWHITIVCEKGVVDLDLWRDIYTFIPNDGVHTAKDITRTSIYATAQHLWGVFTGGVRHVRGQHLYGNVEVVSRFYRAIQGQDSLVGMNPAEGIRVVEMQHEIIAEAKYYP